MSRAPWIDVVAAMIVGAGELGAAIGVHVWFEGLPYDERPVPWLAAVPWVLVGFAVFAWAFGCWRVLARLAELRTRRGAVGTLGLVLLHFAITVGGATGVLVTDPEFLFGSDLDDSLELPDGRTAHLYRGGLFCSYDIFIAAPDDLFSFRARTMSRKSCLEPGRLALDGDRIVITDEHGRPMPEDGGDWSALFDWYPH